MSTFAEIAANTVALYDEVRARAAGQRSLVSQTLRLIQDLAEALDRFEHNVAVQLVGGSMRGYIPPDGQVETAIQVHRGLIENMVGLLRVEGPPPPTQ